MSQRPLRTQLLRLATEDSSLRPKLVRILRANGGLSKDEEQLLKTAVANQTVIQQPPIVIQQSPIVVNQEAPAPAPVSGLPPMVLPIPALAPPMVAPVPIPVVPPATPLADVSPNASPTGVPEDTEPAPVAVMGVPERAQKGFEAELLPELNRLAESGVDPLAAQTEVLNAVDVAFTQKDMLYNILIRYQSSFESDAEYKANIEKLIEAWSAGG